MKRLAAMVILAALWTGSASAECFNTTINGYPYYICNPPTTVVPEDSSRWTLPPPTNTFGGRLPYSTPNYGWRQPPNAGMNGLVPPSTEENLEGEEE